MEPSTKSHTHSTTEEEAKGEVLTLPTRKERRNGLWNIFEGIMEASVLEKLGLSQDLIAELTSNDGRSEAVQSDLTSPDHHRSQASSPARAEECGSCEHASMQRSLSASVGDEVRAALQNRQRRNAVGNLFEVLSPSQQLLLVDMLQEQLKKLCICNGSSTAEDGDNHSGDSGELRGDEREILLAAVRSELSAVAGSSGAGGNSKVSSPRSQGEIVCR